MTHFETYIEYLAGKYEFCPCGDLTSDQCDGYMCEEIAEAIMEQDGGVFAVMPEGLSPEETANFDY